MKLKILLPGSAYTMGFFMSWTKLIGSIPGNWELSFSNHYSPNVFMGRNALLLGSGQPRTDAVPFNGEDYDKILWLETDMVFEPQDIVNLLSIDQPIVSAIYPAGTDAPDAAVAGMFPDLRMSVKKCREAPPSIVPVDYAGLGCIAVAKGVHEAMGYPWFVESNVVNEDGMIRHDSDDFTFCKRAKEAGFQTHVHTGVIVGHQKSIILRGNQ